MTPKYDCFGADKPFTWDDGVSDYVAASGGALSPMGFDQGLASDLTLDRLQEWPYINGWRGYDEMRELGDRRSATRRKSCVFNPEKQPIANEPTRVGFL